MSNTSPALARRAYEIINQKASSNIAIQGLSGILGFPFTLLADGAVIFTHYGTMLNEIRSLYGRTPVSESVVTTIVKGISSELIFDVVADKVLGNVPLITFLRLSLRPVRAAFIAAPKALKSYFGTGLFAIIIHPITFYCSPFLLDMSTLFYQLTKIIHMYMLTTSRFFCIVLLKGGKCLCYIACVFDKH